MPTILDDNNKKIVSLDNNGGDDAPYNRTHHNISPKVTVQKFQIFIKSI